MTRPDTGSRTEQDGVKADHTCTSPDPTRCLFHRLNESVAAIEAERELAEREPVELPEVLPHWMRGA